MIASTQLPNEATAGLTFEAKIWIADYLAPTWSLTATLRGPNTIDISATADNESHLFNVAATDTAKWLPGRYWYSLRATSGSEVREASAGEIVILPDLAQAGPGYDGRSQNEIALEAVNAVLAKKATQDQARYRINNRELWRMAPADLLKLRSYLIVQVRRERMKRNGKADNPFGRKIFVRFSQ